MSLLAFSLLLLLSLARSAGQDSAAPPAQESDASFEEHQAWQRLLERDARVSWTPRTEELARRALDSGDLSEEGRAIAFYALGAGGAIHERPQLEEAALVGSTLERRAAILALGEIGMGVEALLGEEVASPEVGEVALLALLRTGRLAARERADEIAREQGGRIAELATELALFLADPAASRPTDPARLLLELRWKAAKDYGLVDGEAWPIVLLGRLLEQEQFLDEVVLRSAAALSRPGIGDHLLGPLLETGAPNAVLAAAQALPTELEALLENGLWQPADADWRLLVDQLEESGVPPETVPLLRRAAKREDLRLRSLALLARAGETAGLDKLAEEWTLLSGQDRVLVCEAWGSSGTKDALAWLRGRESGASPRVVAAVWLARARLGEAEARDRLLTVLGDPFALDRDAWVDACISLAWDDAVAGMLDETLPVCTDEEQVRAAAGLCLAGRLGPLSILRDALREGLPRGALGLQVLRAVGERGTAEDRQRIARQFPYEREDELPADVNALLVRLMIQDGDLRALPVLRAALWRDPFDRSILAGALVVEIGGDYSLREEIVRRPVDATVRDYRRVGFAAGAWGGMSGLEALAHHPRIHPGDPVLEGALLGALASRTR